MSFATQGSSERILDAFLKTSETVIENETDKIITDFSKYEESIKELRTLIESIAKNKNIIFIVDELDRCKPPYSLEVIEKVKHIFDVKGVHFLFSASSTQLNYSIKHHYGVETKNHDYLFKYFKIIFKLSNEVQLNEVTSRDNAIVYFNTLKQEKKISLASDNFFIEFFKNANEIKKLSLRDVERFINFFEVFSIISKEEHSMSSQNSFIGMN